MMEFDAAQMTRLSGMAYEAATKGGVTPEEAAELLLETVQVRTFRDVLCAFGEETALRRTLVDGLCRHDPDRGRDAMDRKVRGWLGGKYQPGKREDLLELCFVLGLDAGRADAFLTMTGGEGLHWREPREIVYAFALDRGMTYPQAQALHERVAPEITDAEEDAACFTAAVRQEALSLRTEDELARYLREVRHQLGSMHNTAYRHFMDMLELLEAPDPDDPDEKRYTTREVVETYLDRRLPSAREGKSLQEKKRSVLAEWPDEVILSRMRNRRTDVTRKVLILLFLATDGAEAPDEGWQEEWYDEDWDEGEAADADFRSSCMRLNRMLAECGFRMLDPRSAFDWLTLYCMRVEDGDAGMDGLNERLSHVLEVLFAPAD